MKTTIAAIALVALGAAHAYSEDLTVEGAIEIQTKAGAGDFTGRSEWVAMTYYLQGLIEGIGTYQGTLSENDEATVYCPPRGKGYSIEELLPVLRAVPETQKSRPAREVILEHYASQYPCKDGR